LLKLALSHRSWCAENGQVESNERLEFLGDAVLGLTIADKIFVQYPELPEGQLAKVRAGVVNAVTLAQIARQIHLGDSLYLGKGERTTGGADKQSILADALEAVIGAVYLDGGMEAARALVLRGAGTGSSKKEAEQAAAGKAVEAIRLKQDEKTKESCAL